MFAVAVAEFAAYTPAVVAGTKVPDFAKTRKSLLMPPSPVVAKPMPSIEAPVASPEPVVLVTTTGTVPEVPIANITLLVPPSDPPLSPNPPPAGEPKKFDQA